VLWTALTVILTVLYPFIIWLADGKVEPRILAFVLMLTVATRLPSLKINRMTKWLILFGMSLVMLAMAQNAILPLKLYPVLVSMGFLLVFAYSLIEPPSIIERIARLHEPDFPEAAVRYTRRVTQVWCVFFVFNGSAALGLAMWGSQAAWALYTGLISYVLMGVLFAVEYLCRLRFKRMNHA
jgi:uncharacterized membrane protein